MNSNFILFSNYMIRLEGGIEPSLQFSALLVNLSDILRPSLLLCRFPSWNLTQVSAARVPLFMSIQTLLSTALAKRH